MCSWIYIFQVTRVHYTYWSTVINRTSRANIQRFFFTDCASKLWVQEPDTFFGGTDKEIREKRNFFVNSSVPKNFQRENFLGQVPTESLGTQDSENVYERWVQQIFDPVLVARSWVSATKWGPLAKLWAVKKNKHGHNFQNIGSKLNQRGLRDYEPTLIRFGSDILKIVAVFIFFDGSF